MTLECLLKRLVCCFIPYARWRHMIMRNRRDLVRVVEADGTERPLRLFEFRKLYVTEAKGLSGNVVRLSASPGGGYRLNISFHGNGGVVEVGADVHGTCDIWLWDDGCHVRIGARASLGHCQMTVTGSGVEVGDDCLMADHVLFYAGDAHTLIDRATGEVKGARPDPIVIGPHCWLGRECVFTKGAAIPHDTVVGIRAVVTKRFAEPHTALAGCPAKVVTTNLAWDGATPGKYLALFARL